MFHLVNSLKLMTKFIKSNLIVFKFSQTYIKISKDSKSLLIFSLASVVAESLAFL
jgi:hypothetical protein